MAFPHFHIDFPQSSEYFCCVMLVLFPSNLALKALASRFSLFFSFLRIPPIVDLFVS